MKMTCCEAQRTFHLHTPEMSYAFGWAEDGRILHLYWGKALGCDEALAPIAAERLQPSAQLRGTGHQVFEDFELPTREPGDFGEPVVWPRHADGSRGARLRYVRHEIRGEELTVWAADRDYPFEVELHYRGWGDLPLLRINGGVLFLGFLTISYRFSFTFALLSTSTFVFDDLSKFDPNYPYHCL